MTSLIELDIFYQKELSLNNLVVSIVNIILYFESFKYKFRYLEIFRILSARK